VILTGKAETYDGSLRLVMYDADSRGRCRGRLERLEFDDQIDVFYEQRSREIERLLARLEAGEISPVAFFASYHNVTVPDLAARTRLGGRRVRKHLTPRGFAGATVEELARYARVFDVAVCDFFQLVVAGEGIEVEVETSPDRLVQRLTFAAR
jgi:hypothetical protein